MTIIRLSVWAVIFGLILGGCLYASGVRATPIFAAESNGVRIVLTDEPCELKGVANLPLKATWTEKGVEYIGCWGPRPDEGVVLGYFSDLTVVAIPIPLFKRVQGA